MTVTGTKDTQLFLKLQTSHNFKSNNWLLKNTLIQLFCSVMREEEIVLLEFFAPWCPACITFMPELVKLQENVDIPIYKVDNF